MNIMFQRFFVIVLFLAANATTMFAKNKFQVSDTYVTVFAEPERINALGKMYKGEEFEAIGNDGSLLIFMYKGQKAYIASYCCKKIEESTTENTQRTTSDTQVQKVEITSEKEETSDVSASNSREQRHITKSVSMSRKNITSQEVPKGMKSFLGLMVTLGFVFGIWSLFGPLSFSSFFDRLAGKYISSCSKLMHWRPAILLVVFGLANAVAHDMMLSFVIVGIYELCLILYRTKSLGNFRAATVEALYLGANAMGALLLFWMFLILAFLAARSSDGSSSSSESKTSEDRSCDTCIFYENLGLSADQRFCSQGFNGGMESNCRYHQRR